jgi:menaquinone-specific isochorismate synthase
MESARGETETVTAADDSVALVSRACEVTDVSYTAFLAAQDGPRTLWAGPDGLEVAGGGAAVQLTGTGDDRLDDVRTGAEAVFDGADLATPKAARPRMLGGCAFFADHDPSDAWEGFPAAAFVLPRDQLTRAEGATWLTVTRTGPEARPESVERDLAATRERVTDLPAMRPSGGVPGVLDTRLGTSRADWTESVASAVERIRSGDLVKVVLALSQAADVAASVDPTAVLSRLRRSYPDCYRFLLQPDGAGAFFGAPPERLVELTGRSVSTEALAGSAARGETPAADAELAAELRDSEKIQHEQALVAEAIGEQLAGVADVSVGEQTVRKLTTIQHLRTPIEAQLHGEEHVLRLVEALHPTPAVGGVPPDTARAVIRDTEPFDRGWYAAPVGWFDADGDGEFAVGIRSAVADADTVTMFAGNGIVADSDPAAEWDEVQLKFRPILDELR